MNKYYNWRKMLVREQGGACGDMWCHIRVRHRYSGFYVI